MQQRQITLQDIYNAVKCGTSTPQQDNKTKYTHDNIYVILDINNNVVTTCFTKSYTRQLEKFAKQNKIGYHAAIKQIRGGLHVS